MEDSQAGSVIAIVLAAGKGTRMRSVLPKVAHHVGGHPMIAHVHAVISSLGEVQPLYVLGHEHQAVRALLPDDAQVVLQEEQLGTGHAVSIAVGAMAAACPRVLVLYGDMPLITTGTLRSLLDRHHASGARLSVLSAEMPFPSGYGRIVRDSQGQPQRIVEERELQPEQRTLTEVNSGVYAIEMGWLRSALSKLARHESGEYFLTDLVEYAALEGALEVLPGASPLEIIGINDRVQLALAERVLRERTNEALMQAGVTMIDPTVTYIAADASIGADTVIEPQVWIGPGVTIGERCHIGAQSRIIASSVGAGCTILSSVIEYAQIEDDVQVGPFSHLRAGTALAGGVRVGNFAEIKNSSIGASTRVPHFSYLGDATLGAQVNVGAGTVTCNYDGVAKHHTDVGDNVFLGSDTILRAPISIGAGSYTGAGSVVLHDVPEGARVAGVPARPLVKRHAPSPAADTDANHQPDQGEA